MKTKNGSSAKRAAKFIHLGRWRVRGLSVGFKSGCSICGGEIKELRGSSMEGGSSKNIDSLIKLTES